MEAEVIETTEETKPLNVKDDWSQAFDKAVAEVTNPAPPEPEQDEPELETEETQAAEPAADTETEDDSVPDMPASFGEVKKKIWESLTPEAKKHWAGREKELVSLVHNKVSEYENATQRFNSMLQEITPHAKRWKLGKNPVTLEQGVIRAVEFYEHVKSSNKFELAQEIFKNSGKSLQEFVDAVQQKKPDEKTDAIFKRLEAVENRFASQEQQKSEQAKGQYLKTLSGEYDKFANTKNAFGEPKYPQAQNKQFARAMGALVTERSALVPQTPLPLLIAEAYKELGGEIRSGTNTSTSLNQDKERLKRATTTAFGKGRPGATAAKKLSIDDAWAATAEEFGLTD
jgi:hypothetical protein